MRGPPVSVGSPPTPSASVVPHLSDQIANIARVNTLTGTQVLAFGNAATEHFPIAGARTGPGRHKNRPVARKAKHPDEHTMSFGDHLDELRRYVFYAIMGIFPIFFVAMYYSRNLVQLVTAPVRTALHNAHLPASLQSTGVFETFNVSMQMALVVTIILGSPWILWQLWRFIAPGLHNYERRFVYVLLPLSAGLTTAGISFFYFFVFPLVLSFMIDWGVMSGMGAAPRAPLPAGVQLPVFPILEHDPESPPLGAIWINRDDLRLNVAVPSADGKGVSIFGTDLGPTATVAPGYRVREYVGTLIMMALSFAAAFQTPVVVLMLGWVGIIDRRFLSTYRRHAILVSLIMGALLTPGDPMSFILVTIPIYLLYELGGLLLYLLPVHRVTRGLTFKRPRDDDMSEDPPRERAALPPPVEDPAGRNGEH